MNEEKFYVYTHARPNTNDVHGIFYVGKGNYRRIRDLFRRNPHHAAIIKKYGKKDIIVRKLLCESEQHAFDLEIQMIAKLREIGVSLTNATDGGEGRIGHVPTVETRLKMSISRQGNKNRKGIPHSLETIAKISESLKKRPPASEATRLKLRTASLNMSKETKEKISNGLKGRVVSLETRAKHSENAKKQFSSPDARKKMSDAAKSRPPISEETRLKMSESHKKRQAAKRLENQEEQNGIS
jgi:hypothetical protein